MTLDSGGSSEKKRKKKELAGPFLSARKYQLRQHRAILLKSTFEPRLEGGEQRQEKFGLSDQEEDGRQAALSGKFKACRIRKGASRVGGVWGVGCRDRGFVTACVTGPPTVRKQQQRQAMCSLLQILSAVLDVVRDKTYACFREGQHQRLSSIARRADTLLACPATLARKAKDGGSVETRRETRLTNRAKKRERNKRKRGLIIQEQSAIVGASGE